jgi:integrase
MKAKASDCGKHADGQGLWLVKRDKAHGKWVLRLMHLGRRREMGLGGWPEVSIAEARDRAEAARKIVRGGSDPIAMRIKARRAAKPMSVKEAINGCFEARKAELKGDGEAGRWLSPLSVHVIPKIGKYAVEDLDQHVLKELFGPLWHTKPEAAEKALNRLSLTLKHAAALGLNVDLQAGMKARALLGKQRRTTTHIPSLPYPEAPAFYRWLTTLEGTSLLALRFLMLTLGRTSEVRLAVRTEFAPGLWTLPGERTKTGVGRAIPLTTEAEKVSALAFGKSPNKFLFPAYKGQPISDAAMAKLMKDHGFQARPHGFRATFRTWAEEQTDASFEVKESALGHVVDTGLVEAYQRSDRFEKRRALLATWEGFLLRA